MTEINRRELLSGALGTALAASGVSEVKTIDASGEIAGIVLKCPKHLSDMDVANIRKVWEDAFEGTPLSDNKVIILENGMDIEVVRK